VALTKLETCAGAEHARRIAEAFEGTGANGHPRLREKLTDLGYPASRIHRTADRSGGPQVRLDPRAMGSRLALEVTGTRTGVHPTS
jgi:hypothetical protein